MKSIDTQLAAALTEWQRAIGVEFVRTGQSELQQWGTATYKTSQSVMAILQPADAAEVTECVRIANQHRIPVYPVSRGRNWGLGSRVPASDAVVLDLGRLSAITGFENHFGTVAIEPGVTFTALSGYLAEKGAEWFYPTIGGPPSASILGNIVERGDSTGPFRERLSSLASLRVLLADGTIIDTGFERFGDTPLASLASVPAGPSIHSIFTQSNWGIVLRATIWLTPRPAHFQLMHGKISGGLLATCLDAMRTVVLNLGESIALNVWNGYKLEARDRAQSRDGDDWFFTAGIYAPTPSIATGQKELVLDALRPHLDEVVAMDEAATPDLRALAGVLLGQATDANVRSLYCDKPTIPLGDLDPDRDGCGAIWLCPEMPFQGAAIESVLTECQAVFLACGFRPMIGMSAVSSRSVRAFLTLVYDRDVDGNDERAMACYERLQETLMHAGCAPFRLGLHSMDAVDRSEPVWEVLDRVKRALDPNNIIAPRRYSRS